MEKNDRKLLDRKLVLGLFIGLGLAFAIDAIFFGRYIQIFPGGGTCTTDSRLYQDWSQNYSPSNNFAMKLTEEEYQRGRHNYRNSLPQPILDGAYGGTFDVKFLSSYLCQASTEGASEINFYMGQPQNEAAKVMLFSNAPNGMTTEVMTFVVGCPANCRDN